MSKDSQRTVKYANTTQNKSAAFYSQFIGSLRTYEGFPSTLGHAWNPDEAQPRLLLGVGAEMGQLVHEWGLVPSLSWGYTVL